VVYNDDVWLKAMYDAGAGGHFDIISTHPYQGIADEVPEAPDNGTKWRLSHVPAVHRLMKNNGDGDKPIWFTEFGWSNHANSFGLGNWEQGVTAEQQADYFVRAIKFIGANYPYVKKIFWYNERNQDAGKIQLDNYGLLHRDLSPKPVYNRVKNFLGADAPAPEPTPTEEPTVDPTPDPEPTTEPTPDPEPTIDPVDPTPSEKNYLPNGGFEKGRRGWGAKRASLDLARVSYSGERAGRLAPKKRGARVTTTTRRMPQDVTQVEVEGFIRSFKAGRKVKVRLREIIEGRVAAQRSVRFRTHGSGWQKTPSMRLRTTGVGESRVEIRIRTRGATKGRLLVDSFKAIGR
jgi:hypothetical protein